MGALVLPGATLWSGCGDGTGLAGRGSIRVDVNMTGRDRDPDGFAVSVDGGVAREVQAAGRTVFSGVEAGTHDVLLHEVADNCWVVGDNPRALTVVAGETTRTIFDVTSIRKTGNLDVSVRTGGLMLDADGFTVTLDGSWEQPVATYGLVTFAQLAPGDYVVDLSGVAANCKVLEANPQTVTLLPDTNGLVEFTVACSAPVSGTVAFASDRDGDWEIYVLWENSLFPVNLLNDSLIGRDYAPVWSPDGSRIAFYGYREPLTNGDVYLINPDGTGLVDLTNDFYFSSDPSWSPDGTQIAFTSGRDGNREIYVMNADGTDLVNVSNDPGYDLDSAWSPDGTKIAFASSRGGDYDIYVIEADGSNPVNLTKHPAREFEPAWSPDGTKIAFVSDRDGDLEIYVMNADGSGQSRLTNHPGEDWAPAWSPDGSMIAYTHYQSRNNDIFVMNADGSGRVSLINHPADDAWFTWSPKP